MSWTIPEVAPIIAMGVGGLNFVVILQVKLAMQTARADAAVQRTLDQSIYTEQMMQTRHILRNEYTIALGAVEKALYDLSSVVDVRTSGFTEKINEIKLDVQRLKDKLKLD